MKKSVLIVLSILSIFITAQSALSCTAVCMHDNGHIYVGKNYDWSVNSGLMIVNKAGLAKSALVQNNPAEWISKYGSITFNQYGRENPNGGMNEAGLVVEVLWLRSSEYPAPNGRGTIGNLQWVQYQLDNCATIDEVLKTNDDISITGERGAKVHYFIADSTGNTAVIEFLDGKMVAHYNQDMPIQVITNNTYDDSYKYASQFRPFGGDKKLEARKTDVEIFSREASLDRFAQAGNRAQQFKSSSTNDDINYVLNSLDYVKSGDHTVWNIVYDISNRTIYFKSIVAPTLKHIEFSSINFNCNSPVLVIDINSDESGDIFDSLLKYTYELNYNYLNNAIRSTSFLKDMPNQAVINTAKYPEALKCIDK